MNKTEENLYFELESVKKETEASIYDDVAAESVTAATKQVTLEKKTQDARKKRKWSTRRENAYPSDAVVLRRLVFISAAVVAVAFLTAITTLILALSMMMSRNDSTVASKQQNDYGAMYAELKEMKQNIQSLASDKMERNSMALWLAIEKAVNASVNEKLIDVQKQLIQLDQKVINISKNEGPKGQPGYNGTQCVSGPPGPPGNNGTQGLPGPPGLSDSSNLTLCLYKREPSAGVTPDTYADVSVEKSESNGKKFLGVNCDSNDAKFVTISSTISGSKRTYKCTCKGTLSSGDANMYCYIHYWECPT